MITVQEFDKMSTADFLKRYDAENAANPSPTTSTPAPGMSEDQTQAYLDSLSNGTPAPVVPDAQAADIVASSTPTPSAPVQTDPAALTKLMDGINGMSDEELASKVLGKDISKLSNEELIKMAAAPARVNAPVAKFKPIDAYIEAAKVDPKLSSSEKWNATVAKWATEQRKNYIEDSIGPSPPPTASKAIQKAYETAADTTGRFFDKGVSEYTKNKPTTSFVEGALDLGKGYINSFKNSILDSQIIAVGDDGNRRRELLASKNALDKEYTASLSAGEQESKLLAGERTAAYTKDTSGISNELAASGAAIRNFASAPLQKIVESAGSNPIGTAGTAMQLVGSGLTATGAGAVIGVPLAAVGTAAATVGGAQSVAADVGSSTADVLEKMPRSMWANSPLYQKAYLKAVGELRAENPDASGTEIGQMAFVRAKDRLIPNAVRVATGAGALLGATEGFVGAKFGEGAIASHIGKSTAKAIAKHLGIESSTEFLSESIGKAVQNASAIDLGATDISLGTGTLPAGVEGGLVGAGTSGAVGTIKGASNAVTSKSSSGNKPGVGSATPPSDTAPAGAAPGSSGGVQGNAPAGAPSKPSVAAAAATTAARAQYDAASAESDAAYKSYESASAADVANSTDATRAELARAVDRLSATTNKFTDASKALSATYSFDENSVDSIPTGGQPGQTSGAEPVTGQTGGESNTRASEGATQAEPVHAGSDLGIPAEFSALFTALGGSSSTDGSAQTNVGQTVSGADGGRVSPTDTGGQTVTQPVVPANADQQSQPVNNTNVGDTQPTSTSSTTQSEGAVNAPVVQPTGNAPVIQGDNTPGSAERSGSVESNLVSGQTAPASTGQADNRVAGESGNGVVADNGQSAWINSLGFDPAETGNVPQSEAPRRLLKNLKDTGVAITVNRLLEVAHHHYNAYKAYADRTDPGGRQIPREQFIQQTVGNIAATAVADKVAVTPPVRKLGVAEVARAKETTSASDRVTQGDRNGARETDFLNAQQGITPAAGLATVEGVRNIIAGFKGWRGEALRAMLSKGTLDIVGSLAEADAKYGSRTDGPRISDKLAGQTGVRGFLAQDKSGKSSAVVVLVADTIKPSEVFATVLHEVGHSVFNALGSATVKTLAGNIRTKMTALPGPGGERVRASLAGLEKVLPTPAANATPVEKFTHDSETIAHVLSDLAEAEVNGDPIFADKESAFVKYWGRIKDQVISAYTKVLGLTPKKADKISLEDFYALANSMLIRSTFPGAELASIASIDNAPYAGAGVTAPTTPRGKPTPSTSPNATAPPNAAPAPVVAPPAPVVAPPAPVVTVAPAPSATGTFAEELRAQRDGLQDRKSDEARALSVALNRLGKGATEDSVRNYLSDQGVDIAAPVARDESSIDDTFLSRKASEDSLLGIPSEPSTPLGIVTSASAARKAVTGAVKGATRFIREQFVDTYAPFIDWIKANGGARAQALQDALRTGPGIKAATEIEADEKFVQPMLAAVSRLALASGESVDTVIRDAGFWLTARHVPERNAMLILNDSAGVQNGTVTPAELSQRIQSVNDRNPAAKPSRGVAGGMNNALAAQHIQTQEAKYGLDGLEAIADHVYRLNSWKLVKDVETGRVVPGVAALFLRRPQALQALQDVLANPTPATRAAAEAAVLGTKGTPDYNQYVPMTGSPLADNNVDLFGSFVPASSGTNVGASKAAQGRTDSIAEEGLTASVAAVKGTAVHAGYQPLKRELSNLWLDAFQRLNGDPLAVQRELGLSRQKETGATQAGAVITYRDGGAAYVFKFDDNTVADSIQKANVINNRTVEILQAPTRAFSAAVTQWTGVFSMANSVKDVGEKAVQLATIPILNAAGVNVGGWKLAGAMIANANPKTFAAVSRYAWRHARSIPGIFNAVTLGIPKSILPRNRYDAILNAIVEGGGLSILSDTTRAEPKALAKRAATNSFKQAPFSKLMHKIKEGVVEPWNTNWELVSTVAAASAMMDAGVTQDRAIAQALDLMNFRKGGAAIKYIKPFTPFAQPIITGGANLVKQLSSVRGVVNFTLVMGAMYALHSLALAGSDEDENGKKLLRLNDSIWERGIPIPGTNFKVPVPFGMLAFASGLTASLIKLELKEISTSEAFQDISALIASTLTPYKTQPGFANGVKDAIMRTIFGLSGIVTPALQAGFDKGSFGQQLTTGYPNKAKFASEQPKVSTMEAWGEWAEKFRKAGAPDLAPETIRVLMEGYNVAPGFTQLQKYILNKEREATGRQTTNPLLGSISYKENEYATLGLIMEYTRDAQNTAKSLRASKQPPTPMQTYELDWLKRADKLAASQRGQAGQLSKQNKETDPRVLRDMKRELRKRQEQASKDLNYEWRIQHGISAKRTVAK